MKVLISADMEGVTGVTCRTEVAEGGADYERFRRLMTADVNAAVEGACAAGATRILVNDSHWSMRNIFIEELDSRAELISGSLNKPLCMMEGIDYSFDAAFLVGYHPRAGCPQGVMNHTLLGREIVEVRMNGRPIGEIGINAAIAGYFGVPIVMVSGDQAAVQEAVDWLGQVEAALTKEGIERWTARCLPPSVTAQRIKSAAQRALMNLNSFQPLEITGPVEFEIDFLSTSEAEVPTLFPQVEKVGARTIKVTGKDIIEAFKMCWGSILLAWSASDELYG